MSETINLAAQALHRTYVSNRSKSMSWEELGEYGRNLWREEARAAIEALRKPAFDPEAVSYHEGMTRADWWRAMIDAALANAPP